MTILHRSVGVAFLLCLLAGLIAIPFSSVQAQSTSVSHCSSIYDNVERQRCIVRALQAGDSAPIDLAPFLNLIWWAFLISLPLMTIGTYIVVQISLVLRTGEKWGFLIGSLFLPPLFFPLVLIYSSAVPPQRQRVCADD